MKKKEVLMWGIIAVLVVVALIFSTQGQGKAMAIDFTTQGQAIDFGASAATGNLANKSICDWIDLDAFGYGAAKAGYILSQFNSDNNKGWGFYITDDPPSGDAHTQALRFFETKTTTTGAWTSGKIIDISSKTLVCVTYNNDVASNPIFYVGGLAKSDYYAEFSTPVGTSQDASENHLVLGNVQKITTAYPYAINGRSHGPIMYNRILSAAEILEISNARGRWYPKNGLVFCPFTKGAAGLQVFDGAALAAGNTIVDPCSGAVGVPAGSPVGVGETYLSSR